MRTWYLLYIINAYYCDHCVCYCRIIFYCCRLPTRGTMGSYPLVVETVILYLSWWIKERLFGGGYSSWLICEELNTGKGRFFMEYPRHWDFSKNSSILLEITYFCSIKIDFLLQFKYIFNILCFVIYCIWKIKLILDEMFQKDLRFLERWFIFHWTVKNFLSLFFLKISVTHSNGKTIPLKFSQFWRVRG